MLVVVGLGNPGMRYASTRHNVGHMVVNELAARAHGSLAAHRSGTHLLTGRLMGADPEAGKFIFATPDSYMNVSGGPVKSLLNYFKVTPGNLLVIHDDLDLPEHALKLKKGGGEGGHNGLKSISSALGTKDYGRLRLGIGRPPGTMDAADYVLREVRGSAKSELDVTVNLAADAVEDILMQGFDRAQLKLHSA